MLLELGYLKYSRRWIKNSRRVGANRLSKKYSLFKLTYVSMGNESTLESLWFCFFGYDNSVCAGIKVQIIDV